VLSVLAAYAVSAITTAASEARACPWGIEDTGSFQRDAYQGVESRTAYFLVVPASHL
jgi:hypothetical protein